MPLPAWRDRLPKKQSLKEQFLKDIQTQEKNLILGPVGASATAVHPTREGSSPVGKPPREMHDRELREVVNRDASR